MPDPGDFTGKVALVTGGARNLGAAITRHLAERGAHVIINYFHATDAAAALQSELEAGGYSSELVRASVAKHATVDRMFDEITERHDGLDILVNNAAAGAFLPLFEADDVFWERAFHTNVMGPVWCAKRAVPLMEGRAGASIVCLSSVGSQRTALGYGTIGWTKAAVECLVRYLAYELAPAGIRVNTLLAGLIENDVYEHMEETDRLVQVLRDWAPLKRSVSNADIARLVGFLASDAAGMITGEALTADCGALAAAPFRGEMNSKLRTTVATTAPAATGPVEGLSSDAPDVGEVPTPDLSAGGLPALCGDTTTSGESAAQRDLSAPPSGIIAVVGTGVALPHANSPHEAWQRLREGAPLFSEPTRFDIDSYSSPAPTPDRGYLRLGGFIGDFQPTAQLRRELREGDWPVDAPLASTLLRHCAIDATQGVTSAPGDRWACVTAAAVGPYPEARYATLLGAGYQAMAAEHLNPGLEELARHAIAARYNSSSLPALDCIAPFAVRKALSGLVPDAAELVCLDSACASSLHAVDIAVKALREGSCDIAVCSAMCVLDPLVLVTMCKAQGLSPSGRLRPFQSDADGTLLGEGAVSVTLKTLERAQRDGDQILGLILGTATGSDGKGKGVHAPSVEGQAATVRRAWGDAGVRAEDLDWVIAHGTGTPLGDEVELRALRSNLGDRRQSLPITSNKSVFSHSGPAAGLTSLVHALQALKHSLIPCQPDFTDPRSDLADDGLLNVPTYDLPWQPGPGRPRIAGISAFGLGGSDAHIVVADRSPLARLEPAKISRDDIVVTAWATHLPDSTEEASRDWLAGTGAAPSPEFGDDYPLPSPREIRIPPVTMSHMDRGQLMALRSTKRVLDQLGTEEAARLSARTAVVGATMAPLRLYSRLLQRVSLDDCAKAFDGLPERESAEAAYGALRAAVLSVTLETTEDDFTGTLTCVNTGRIANYFNLRGPNLVVHGGLDSGQLAIRTAVRLLAHHSCDLALVNGISANTLPEWQQALTGLLPSGRLVCEGSVTIALARRSTAVRVGLPVLATVETEMTAPSAGTPALGLSFLADTKSCYPGIDALLAVPHSVLTRTPLDLAPTEAGAAYLRIRPHAESGPPAVPYPTASDSVSVAPLGTPTAYALVDAGPDNETWTRDLAGAVPEGSLVITDDPQLAAAVGRTGVQVWTPPHASKAAKGKRVSPQNARAKLAKLSFPPRHVRILVRLRPTAGRDVPEDTLALHDLAFAATQAMMPVLDAGGSLAALVLGALREDRPDPRAGLFDGLIRCAATEAPQAVCATIMSDTGDTETGLGQLAAEWRRQLPHHVIAYRGTHRLTYALTPATHGTDASATVPLGKDSVVVSAGGSRGIAAELLAALAEQAQPHIYVLGRTPVADAPPGPAPARAAFLRERHAQTPDIPIRALLEEHAHWSKVEEIRQNLTRLEAQCGTDKVHYLACDVLNETELAQAMDHVLTRHDRIDLLINTVLDVRSRAIASKPVADFRAVRDTKVRGYHNLLKALAGRFPRIWCNFSSLSVMFGTPGDIDYVAASEYLNHVTGLYTPADCREFTLLWPLWTDTGSAASPEIIEGFRKRGLTAFLPTAVGRAQFLDALARPVDQPVLSYIRDEERDALAHSDRLAPTSSPQRDGNGLAPLVEQQVLAGGRWGIFAHSLPSRNGRNGWSRHHRVNDTPVVPGIFVLEMAAEAAAHMFPNLKVVGFRDLICHATLNLPPGRPPRNLKIETTVLKRNTGSARVRVDVLLHRTNASGRVLRHDTLCQRVEVLLGAQHPTLTGPGARDISLEPAELAVPAYLDNTHVHLSGPFTGARHARRGASGITAEFFHDAPQWKDDLAGFQIPVMLLEATTHLLTLPPAEAGDTGVVGVLQSIARIDLATPGNDTTLATRYPEPITLRTTFPPSQAQAFAVAPDETVLARVSGLSGRSRAVVNTTTGAITPTTGPPGWWGAVQEATS